MLWDVNENGINNTGICSSNLIIKQASEIRALTKQPCYTDVVDVSDRQLVYVAAKKILDGPMGQVDILVNNAGIVQGNRLLSPNWRYIEAESNF